MLFIKIILSFALALILFQDYKERQVYWFLFPLIGLLGGALFFKKVSIEIFINAVLINLIFVLFLLLIVLLYARLKLKTNILNTIGLGDILFFLFSTVFFSSVSFIIIFISALIFSLLLHLYKKPSSEYQVTVPLAGYMALFFLTCYSGNWLGLIDNLYIL